MAFTPGDFSPSAIGATIIKEKQAIGSPRTSELNKDIIAGAALLQHQDPGIIPMSPGISCANAKLYTYRIASTDKAAKTMACAVGTGPEAGTETVTVTKEVLVNNEYFKIDEDFCANAETFTDVLANSLARAKANLELKLSKALIAAAVAGADTPVDTWFKSAPNGAVNGTIFEVPTAEFTSALLADMQWIGKYLGFNQGIVLNGRNFYNESILKMYESAGCATNDAILNTNKVFNVFWDSQNIDQVTGAESSFIIDKNALLFWSSPFYSNVGIESMMTAGKEPSDRFHYVDTLPRLQYYANGKLNPIYVDVRAEWSCATDTQGVPRTSWKFELMLAGAIVKNLANQDGYQGIIRVDQIAGA